MINVLVPAVPVPCGGNVQVAGDFLHFDAPVDATGRPVCLMVVGRLEGRLGAGEDGEEPLGPSRRGDNFPGGLGTAVFTAGGEVRSRNKRGGGGTHSRVWACPTSKIVWGVRWSVIMILIGGLRSRAGMTISDCLHCIKPKRLLWAQFECGT